MGLGRFGTRSCTRVFGWAVGMDGLPGCCPNCRCVAGFGWLARKSAVPARFRCAPSRSRASPYTKSESENSLCASTTGFPVSLFVHCSLPTWTLYHNSPLFPMLNISYNLKQLYQYRGYCGQNTDIHYLALGQWCYGKQVLHKRNKHDNA